MLPDTLAIELLDALCEAWASHTSIESVWHDEKRMLLLLGVQSALASSAIPIPDGITEYYDDVFGRPIWGLAPGDHAADD